MIEAMDRSTDTTLGFTLTGDVTKADYEELVPKVATAVDANGSVSLLLDLTGFRWEKLSAWGSDLGFGKDYHDKIDKMAIVGDKKWEHLLAKLAHPFYAKHAEFFETTDAAWTWLES
jgi:hypothetical protein